VIVLKDYKHVPDLAYVLYSIPFAMENKAKLYGKNKGIVLTNNGVHVYFGNKILAGSSYLKTTEMILIICEDAYMGQEMVKPPEKDEANKKRREDLQKKVTFDLSEDIPRKLISHEEIHAKLGHPGHERTIATAKKLGYRVKGPKVCVNCKKAKAKRKGIKKSKLKLKKKSNLKRK